MQDLFFTPLTTLQSTPPSTLTQEYLERYYMLIAFTGYLQSPQFDPGSSIHTRFPDWMGDRTELRRCVIIRATVERIYKICSLVR